MKPFVLTLLIALSTAGCHHQSDSTTNVESDAILNRLPAPVAAAFRENHPHVLPTRVHVRLYPDGSTHYQVMYVDSNGQPQEAEFYSDGRKAT